MELDLLCVCVTFIDEWASLSEKNSKYGQYGSSRKSGTAHL